MFVAITQYKATGRRGGYTLQWQGSNKPSYIIGNNSTCCWFKFKADAVKSCAEHNQGISK